MKVSCNFYDQGLCQSCDWLDQDYLAQLEQKQQKARSALGLPHIKVEGSELSSFRDKIKLAVGGTIDHPQLGIVNLKQEIQDLTGCVVQNRELNQQLSHIKEFIKLSRLTPYSITHRTGELKHLIMFYSPHTQERYLRFVLRSKEALSRIEKHLDHLKYFHVISANIQPKPAAILEGEEEIILTPKIYIQHQLNQQIFYLHPQSFVQTNTLLAEKLYLTAKTWTQNLNISKVVDLFCGFGPFAFHLSQPHLHIWGYEVNAASIESALKSNERQGKNIIFLKQNTHHLEQLPDCDLLVVNPPRRGLGETLKLILQSTPAYLLYSSCDIESLSQDWLQLKTCYQIEQAEIFDFFPHTHHFETLVLLKRR